MGTEGSRGARSSHYILRNCLLFADLSQVVLQGQTHSRRQVTNAFDLPLLQQWGGCSHTGHGGGWFEGLSSELREDHAPPQPPYGPPALLLSSKGICFHSAECTEHKQTKGSHIPLYLNTSCRSQWQTHQCQGPCRALPMFHLCPQSGDAMAGAFPPIVFHSCCPHALPGGLSPSALKALPCRAGSGAGGTSACLGCPGAPPGTLPRFPNLPSPGQHCDTSQNGERVSLPLRGWTQGLLQELLNLDEVCFQLLVEQQEGWVGAWC